MGLDGELGLQTSCVFLFFFFNDISFDNLRLWKKETHACPKIPFKKITRSLHQREVSFEESAARSSRRLSCRKKTSPERLTAVVLPDSARGAPKFAHTNSAHLNSGSTKIPHVAGTISCHRVRCLPVTVISGGCSIIGWLIVGEIHIWLGSSCIKLNKKNFFHIMSL